jgi:hypothetical protein
MLDAVELEEWLIGMSCQSYRVSQSLALAVSTSKRPSLCA